MCVYADRSSGIKEENLLQSVITTEMYNWLNYLEQSLGNVI